MNAWLGVVSRAHVQRGVSLGIARVNHGKRAGLAHLEPGDWFVYYSPKTGYPDGEPLKAFTAIGVVADSEIVQVEEGDFRPFQRAIDYELAAKEVPIADFGGSLDLTAGANWGYQLRRGIVPLSDHDINAIRAAMTA